MHIHIRDRGEYHSDTNTIGTNTKPWHKYTKVTNEWSDKYNGDTNTMMKHKYSSYTS